MVSSNNDGIVFNIEKLDGTHFPFWKEQVFNVLVQKKQAKPIKYEGRKPDTMSQEDQEDMDMMTRSTIMLSLSKDVYYNVKGTTTSYELWQKLCNLYEQKSPMSQIYWLKKLVELRMKEGTPMSNHLNEFNSIYSHLIAQEVSFLEPVKVLFLLINLSGRHLRLR